MKHLFLFLILCLSVLACKKDKDNEPCPDGYTGENCDLQVAPFSIKIQSIKVKSFPPTDNGAGWDLTSGADIYVAIWYDGAIVYNNKASFFQNAVTGPTFNINFTLPEVKGYYGITLYDFDDFDPDDFMGGIDSYLYSSTNGFPDKLTLDCSSCAVSFELALEYIH